MEDWQCFGAGMYLETQSVQENFALEKYITLFQAEVYVILSAHTRAT